MSKLYDLFFWLFILIITSYILAEGADRLGLKIGRRFMGRIILGIATTFPEFVIVYFAAVTGLFDVGIGAVFGSNILMMSLGLSVMVLIATTRLSLKPLKEISTKVFKLDFYFLIFTAVLAVVIFIDGFNLMDGIIFAIIYFVYVYLAYKEIKIEKEEIKIERNITKKEIIFSTIAIIIGALGIIIAGKPFTVSVKEYSIEIGISGAILALLIAPIAGEMPEKLSLMFLARKGGKSVEISIGNIFGSKILNNTLLITTFIFAAIIYQGINTNIEANSITFILVAWAGLLTMFAMLTFVDNKLSKKDGILLLLLYVITIILQIYLIRY